MSELPPLALSFCKYLSWKMQMLALQEDNKIKLDISEIERTIEEYEALKEEKVKNLTEAMPKVPVLKKVNEPKVMYKKDGTLSAQGQKWFQLLREQGLSPQTKGVVSYIAEYKDPNPNSPDQVKEWLYSLGWKPQTFKFVKDGDKERKIEQIRKDGVLCPSVEVLEEREPAIEYLNDLTVLTHRLGILKGYLKESEGGYIVAGAGGLTNTLRMKHRAPVTNLPSVDAKFGKPCRSVLVADEGKIMVGSDVTSLEDSLKQHFIQPHDPEYVEEMNVEGFDPHLRLGVEAGKVTLDEYMFYLWYEKENG